VKTFTTRYMLIPLALLAVVILAACTPITPTPDANAPMTPGSNSDMMNNDSSGSDMNSGQTEKDMLDNSESGDDMMGGQSEEEMMGGQSEEDMMGGNDQSSMATADLTSLARHMNATFAPMQNLVGLMSDMPEANAMAADMENMQKEMNGMLENPDPERLGELMQETGDMMNEFQAMMETGQFSGDPDQVAAQMNQIMNHMGAMANMLDSVQGSQSFMDQMNGWQQQFGDDMMAGNMMQGDMMQGLLALVEDGSMTQEELNALLDQMDALHQTAIEKMRDGSMTQDDVTKMANQMHDMMEEAGLSDMMNGQGLGQ